MGKNQEEKLKIFELDENENTTDQNLQGAMKPVLRGNLYFPCI